MQSEEQIDSPFTAAGFRAQSPERGGVDTAIKSYLQEKQVFLGLGQESSLSDNSKKAQN